MSDETKTKAKAPEPKAEPSAPKRLPDTGVVTVRAVDESLRGYFVLGRPVTADGFELDLATLSPEQRADLVHDRCLSIDLPAKKG